MRRVVAAAAVAIVIGAVVAPAVTAQDAQPAGRPSQDEFVPVKDLPQQESLPAAPLVIAAYVLVWLVLLVFVWSVRMRLGKVSRDLDELSRRVADAGRKG